MFTGLIGGRGRVFRLERRSGSAVLSFSAGSLADELSCGDSIAVNGVCLTVTSKISRCVTADVSAETLRKTLTGTLSPGDEINLELPLAAGDRYHGHVVTGHVAGAGTVGRVVSRQGSRWLTILIHEEIRRQITLEDSVAVDGVSLTVSAVSRDAITVCLIPETLSRTSLGRLRSRDRVNIEPDRFKPGRNPDNNFGEIINDIHKNKRRFSLLLG